MIAAYADFLPAPLVARLAAEAEPVPEVPGLSVAPGLRQQFPRVETVEALSLVVEVYEQVEGHLAAVLERRKRDRRFLDAVTLDAAPRNAERPFLSAEYETAIGRRDASGRVVLGPPQASAAPPRVEVPAFIAGEQVTLFGPPDTARMSINAMNALHRRRADEPARVAELVTASGQVPRWGADDEDSKTPIMANFLRATENIQGCFDGTLRFDTPQRSYRLAERDLARPIKRVPGLALPDGSHLLHGAPLPLHLYDLVVHAWHNRVRPEALVFYFPKLENEEEAAYLHDLIARTEAAIQVRHPAYQPGTIRVLVVFENPRAIFRIREIAAALAPHFLGGSLGWHDFLASTARLFRHDPRYRIPVKADPNIVIDRIHASHRLLVTELGPIGALRIGGMYGVLFEEGDERSYRVSMAGYIKDVVTQLKRGLDGFWVAHPDFVRVGLALVEAWRRKARDPDDDTLVALIADLLPEPDDRDPVLQFVLGPDVAGLDRADPSWARAVLAADLETSNVIANDDPREIQYNVFQALQYLADWLSGNGCVALPATLADATGRRVAVRIMDDLATTERSRWELWAEVHHGRVAVESFDAVLAGELAAIAAGATGERRVAVPWAGEAARWYPIAGRLLRQLVTEPEPVEFATELLLPFTFPAVREADDPWAAATALCPGKYR